MRLMSPSFLAEILYYTIIIYNYNRILTRNDGDINLIKCILFYFILFYFNSYYVLNTCRNCLWLEWWLIYRRFLVLNSVQLSGICDGQSRDFSRATHILFHRHSLCSGFPLLGFSFQGLLCSDSLFNSFLWFPS